jgi:DNA-binding NarL/FixJ family response regulator
VLGEGRPGAGACSKLGGMPSRVSSARFVGRRAELEVLEKIWKNAVSDEHAATVLVAGEAGVGKSRLVAELTGRLADPALVLVGQCMELVDRALPFGPIVQILRKLHGALDDVTLDAIVGSARDEIGALLPELRGARDELVVTGALFEQLLGVFERLGDRIPTLLVIEDLHWADRSTRELLVFLARTMQTGRIVLLGTYRSDDLDRRHPLRLALVELERAGAVERVEVQRFDRDEVRELIAAIEGSEPAAELVDRTFERSDGNAFFAEELLAVSGSGDAIPPTLRDILLARVDALSEHAQLVVQCAAVAGSLADHRIIAAMTKLSDADLRLATKEAIAHQILVADPDGVTFSFRHALVEEAVYEDLLPGDRVALHTSVAELLTEHPEWFTAGVSHLTAELACHWDAARNVREALVSALAAGRIAEQMYAYGDALAHSERVLTLWSQVADAEELTGLRHVDMMRLAAMHAEMSGSTDRALDYVKAALDEVDPETDPITAGLLHERWGRYLWMLSLSWDDILWHCNEAVRLVPPAAIAERAKVLSTLGQQTMLASRNREAIDICDQAIALAQQAGDRVTEGHAANSKGSALAAIGRFDEGIAELHRARDIAIETRSWADVARAAVNEGGALNALARHEEALAIALHGAEEARAHGLDRSFGSFLRLNACESLYMMGRWPEVEEQLREVEVIGPVGIDYWRIAELRALLAVGHGDLDAARRYADEMASHLSSETSVKDHVSLEYIRAVVSTGSGDFEDAAHIADVATSAPVEDISLCSDLSLDLLLEGLQAAANVVERDGRSDALDRVEALSRRLESWIADDRWDGGWVGDLDALRAHVAAELGRAQSTADAAAWIAVAQRWDDHKLGLRATYARFRAAEAALRTGDRETAETVTREAYAQARRMDWTVMRDTLADLARRARLDLDVGDDEAPTTAERYGLTARELDVLALVAEGHTNRQIADALFISAKTASVHVSNILGKLHVANRGEAAAAARRLGLDLVPTQS